MSKAEAEGSATQKSNQFFQKWKEGSEKLLTQQQKMDELISELSKVCTMLFQSNKRITLGLDQTRGGIFEGRQRAYAP